MKQSLSDPFLQWWIAFWISTRHVKSASHSTNLVRLITGLEYALLLPVVREVADSRNNWNFSLHSSWRKVLFCGLWSSLSWVLLGMSASHLSDIQLLTCPLPIFKVRSRCHFFRSNRIGRHNRRNQGVSLEDNTHLRHRISKPSPKYHQSS